MLISRHAVLSRLNNHGSVIRDSKHERNFVAALRDNRVDRDRSQMHFIIIQKVHFFWCW